MCATITAFHVSAFQGFTRVIRALAAVALTKWCCGVVSVALGFGGIVSNLSDSGSPISALVVHLRGSESAWECSDQARQQPTTETGARTYLLTR